MLKTIDAEIVKMEIFFQNKKKMLVKGMVSDKQLIIVDPFILDLKIDKTRHHERPIIFRKGDLIIKLKYE